MLVFGFMKSDRFDGTYSKSVLKFERQGLESAEIQFDSQPIVGHPLTMNGTNSNDFFLSYLKNTNRFLNPLVTGSLSNEDYEKWNFLIFTNLKNDDYKHGQLTLKLNFRDISRLYKQSYGCKNARYLAFSINSCLYSLEKGNAAPKT